MKSFIPLVYVLMSIAALHSQQNLDFQTLQEFLQQKGQSPENYVLSKFNEHDVVFLAEDHAIRDNLLFVAGLISDLHKAGVYNIGMEFGASEDQARLDSLVSSPSYDESVARDIMFSYNTGWAYQEYMDIYRATWEFNQSLPREAIRFRILNISYRYNWLEFKGQRTPDNMAKVFYRGTADKYRAELIENVILGNKQKILLLVGTPHAFTRYQSPLFVYNRDNFCMFDDNWLGNRLYKKYGPRIFSIFLHHPLSNQLNVKPALVLPADGLIEKALAGQNNHPVGFDLLNSVAGKLPDKSYWSMCHPDFTLEQFFDGYIFLKPVDELQGCTFDTLFYKGISWQSIKEQMPDPDWRKDVTTLSDFIKQIKDYVNLEKRYRGLKEQ